MCGRFEIQTTVSVCSTSGDDLGDVRVRIRPTTTAPTDRDERGSYLLPLAQDAKEHEIEDLASLVGRNVWAVVDVELVVATGDTPHPIAKAHVQYQLTPSCESFYFPVEHANVSVLALVGQHGDAKLTQCLDVFPRWCSCS